MRKQSADNALFVRMAREIESRVSRTDIDALVEYTQEEIQRTVAGRKVAFAWSGGKDSIALQGVCEAIGISSCVMGLTHLEYPAFLQWVTDNMPDGLTVINTGQGLDWLSKNLDMLFPRDSAIAAKWFHVVQHAAQEKYYKENRLGVILLGRRREDGNFVGRAGVNSYESKGILRYSPLDKWTHEHIIAYNHYHKQAMPPIYTWENGFVQGTHPWAQRQYTASVMQGWEQVYRIDPSIVVNASTKIESASLFLKQAKR